MMMKKNRIAGAGCLIAMLLVIIAGTGCNHQLINSGFNSGRNGGEAADYSQHVLPGHRVREEQTVNAIALWSDNDTADADGQGTVNGLNNNIDNENIINRDADDGKESFVLFYPDFNNSYLVPVTRRLPPAEGIARAVLTELVERDELLAILSGTGLSPLLPAATAIRGINIEEGLATVNFSASFMQYDEEEENLVLKGVFSTLKQFNTIDRVNIQVEGVNLEQLPGFGAGQFPLGPACRVNLEVSNLLEDYSDYQMIRIYYCHHAPSGRVFYVPVSRVVNPVGEEATGAEIAETALNELFKGPRRGSGLYSDLPAGIELLSLAIEDETAVVNLSAEFSNYRGGLQGLENMVNQVVLTVTDNSPARVVKIMVNGAEATLQGFNLSAGLSRPKPLNPL